MYQLHWIKLSTDLFGNPKIRCLMALPEGQSAVLLWVFLLTAAGRTNDGGRIGLTDTLPYTPDTLAVQVGLPKETVEAGLEQLFAFDMLRVDPEGFLWIRSWEEHQEKPAQAEPQDERERNRIRKAKSRAAKNTQSPAPEPSDACSAEVTEAVTEKPVTCHTDVTDPVTEKAVTCHTDVTANVTDEPVTCHADVTDPVTQKAVTCHTAVTADVKKSHSPNKDIDIEAETEAEAELLLSAGGRPPALSDKKQKNVFRPPTVEQVAAFCKARGSRVDPRQFVDYYTANGWRVGRNKMSDWQAAVRTWERNGRQAACAAGCPPGAVMGPTGVPILVPVNDELKGIL